MSECGGELESLLGEEVVYDGEGYSRESLRQMLSDHQVSHKQHLKSLAELSTAHDDIASEITKDLAENKSAWEHVRNIITFHRVSSNVRGLLEKVPVLSQAVRDRPLGELLEEKIEVSQRRVQQIGGYLDTMQHDIHAMQQDISQLNKRMIVAAQNEERAAEFVIKLESALAQTESQLQAMPDEKAADARVLQTKRDELKQVIWRHGAKLRLYSNAEDRISSLVRMDNNFLEILTSLHGNMQTLFESGNEVLNELQGNLTGLASAAKAADLTMEMQRSMESLKDSVNKVAVLASDTSLYLTQNVERLTSQMKIYDEETQQLVESNLQAEREIKEERINDTIALAHKEHAAFQRARSLK